MEDIGNPLAKMDIESQYVLVPRSDLSSFGAPASPAGQSRLPGFGDLLATLIKYWWLILAITLATLGAAALVTFLTKPVYEARVTMEVNYEPIRVTGGPENQPAATGEQDFIATQVGLLRSRSLSERVARSLNLARDPAFGGSEAAAAARVRSGLSVMPPVQGRLVTIDYQAGDGATAARVANAIAQNYMSSNLERQYSATAYAREFLNKRIASTKTKLEESERELADYARSAGIINLAATTDQGRGDPTSASTAASQLRALNESLAAAEADTIQARRRAQQAQGSAAVGDVVRNETVQTLRQQRAQLLADYQDKLGVMKPDYPEMQRLKSRIDELSKQINVESSSVRQSVTSEYRTAAGREADLRARVQQLKGSVLDLGDRTIRYTILQREVDTSRSLYESLLQRYKEVSVERGVGSNLVSIVDAATAPTRPLKPNVPLNLAGGLILGLALGAVAAFAVEHRDDTVRVPADIVDKLGLPLLGVIPRARKGIKVHHVQPSDRSEMSEAYASARTSILFAAEASRARTLLVTSTRPGEGKTTSAYILALQFAKAGFRTLLIDCDLRKASSFAKGASDSGLTALLTNGLPLESAIFESDVPGLHLLPSGKVPSNPTELLTLVRMQKLLDETKRDYQYVIIDSPPVMGLADAPLLASICDGVVLIVEAGGAPTSATCGAIHRLRASRAKLLGGLMTKHDIKTRGNGYGYGYGYGYGHGAPRPLELTDRRENSA